MKLSTVVSELIMRRGDEQLISTTVVDLRTEKRLEQVSKEGELI